MDEKRAALLERYRPLMDSGKAAREVYTQARADGYKVFEAMGAVHHLFGISLEDANHIKQQVDGFGPGMLPMETAELVCSVLKLELGYCEDDAVLLLRDILLCLRDRDYRKGQEVQQQAFARLLERLNYAQNPGLAAWFMHTLYQRNIILDGFIDGFYPQFCRIAPKGEWILDGIERLYRF